MSFNFHNIYKIWFSFLQKIIQHCDVIIDEDSDIYKVIKLMNASLTLLKNSFILKNSSAADLSSETASSVLK